MPRRSRVSANHWLQDALLSRMKSASAQTSQTGFGSGVSCSPNSTPTEGRLLLTCPAVSPPTIHLSATHHRETNDSSLLEFSSRWLQFHKRIHCNLHSEFCRNFWCVQNTVLSAMRKKGFSRSGLLYLQQLSTTSPLTLGTKKHWSHQQIIHQRK